MNPANTHNQHTERDQMKALIVDRLAGLQGFSTRAMFGGYGLYLEGDIFGVIAEKIYFKTDAKTRVAYTEAGMSPWNESKHYYEVPPAALADPDRLMALAREAAAITAAEKAKKAQRARITPK
jgi:DNA transformation protein